MRAKLNSALNPALIQFIKFGMVGLLNTTITYVITNSTYYLLHLNELICNAIAFFITVYISYILNSQFVFTDSSEQNTLKAILKVYISYSFTGLFLSSVLIYIEESIFGIPHFIATLVILIITIPLNFLINKYWAYRIKE